MAASASGKEELPYALKQLNWDSLHHFNSQNTYGYKGEERLLSDAMLQCDMCEQWFFNSEVACVPKEAAPFVPFQRNYRFSCRICTGGAEQFELQTNTWTSIVLTAIYNLLLSDDGSSLKAGEWLKVKDVVAWVQSHWGGLAAGRNQAQMLENSAVSKCLLYTQNNGARVRAAAPCARGHEARGSAVSGPVAAGAAPLSLGARRTLALTARSLLRIRVDRLVSWPLLCSPHLCERDSPRDRCIG